MGHHAVYFFSDFGGMVGSLWSAPDYFAFLRGVGLRLHVNGAGADVGLAVCGQSHFRNYYFQYFHGVCLCYGCNSTGAPRQTIWTDQRGIWTWIHYWPCGGRATGQCAFATSVLDRCGAKPGERDLWIFYFAGIAAAGTPREESVAHGESAWLLDAFALASGTWRLGHRHVSLLFGAPGSAHDFRVVRRLPLRMERAHHRTFARDRGIIRKPCVWLAGRSICEAFRRAVQLVVRAGLWLFGFLGICAGFARMDGVCGNSLDCFMGHCRACDAIAYVSAGGCHFSGKAARRC